MKYYSIGEIFRQKLLLNYKGKPYKDKATIGRVVGKMKYRKVKTPWGLSKQVSEKEIEKHNSTIRMINGKQLVKGTDPH